MGTRRIVPTAPGLLLCAGLLLSAAPVWADDGDAETQVAAAEAAAARGDAEAILFALFELSDLPGALERRALDALVRGATSALDGGDPILGLQLCQMALRHQATHRLSLIRCIQAAEALDQYDPAEAWTATLREAHPQDVEGALIEARLYLAQGAWSRARDAARKAEGLEAASEQDRARARLIRERAEAELAQREEALSEIAALSQQLETARAARAETGGSGQARERRPARPGRRAARTPEAPVTSGSSQQVILYVTSWCGACQQAAQWLRGQGIPFVEKDIERDSQALTELAAKAQARGIQPRGVPVIDVAGELLVGFSEQSLRQALTRKGML
jgi:glutaredoxin